MKNNLNLKEQAAKIIEQAQKKGVESNYFFVTTFKRYQVQLEILDKLEKSIKEHGELVEKEYVKGRKNLMANPAIVEYNKTSTAANGTVTTLIKIVESLANEDEGGGKLRDLASAINAC